MNKGIQNFRNKIEGSGLLESVQDLGVENAEKVYSEWLFSIAPDGYKEEEGLRILQIAVAAHSDANLRRQLTGVRPGPPTKWTDEIRTRARVELEKIIREQGMSKDDASTYVARRTPYRELLAGSSNPGGALLRQIQLGAKQERTLRPFGVRVAHFVFSRLKECFGFRKWIFGSKKRNKQYGDW